MGTILSSSPMYSSFSTCEITGMLVPFFSGLLHPFYGVLVISSLGDSNTVLFIFSLPYFLGALENYFGEVGCVVVLTGSGYVTLSLA